jgi:glycosyltransferase involved in cell wall biosynthesis
MAVPEAAGRPAVPVAFVGSHAQLGGSERVLERLLGALGPAWIDRVVLLQDGPAVARLAPLCDRLEVLPTGRRLGLLIGAWRLRRRLLADPPRLVHANGVKAALVAALALAGTRIPVVWHKHDLSWDGPLARLVAAGCVEVVGVSAVVLASLRRGRPRGLRRPRLAVVPNGVPEPRAARAAARAAIARELSLPAGAPLVALLGRLHAAKGQLELVDAAPALLEKVPEAQLLLVGGDDPTQAAYAGSVRARVRSAALRGHVHLLGHRDDAEALVAAADVLAVPSVQDERGMGREGFGLAGVEALAAGTPVVGYADGALPEVLGDAAVLVAPGDRAALAQALAALLTDEARRATLVRRGRARYEARFRLDVTAAAMAERYRSAVGQRSTEP